MYILYHPKVNKVTVEYYYDEDNYHSPSFCVWIVPGTVDINED